MFREFPGWIIYVLIITLAFLFAGFMGEAVYNVKSIAKYHDKFVK
jgi:hypothetical protein